MKLRDRPALAAIAADSYRGHISTERRALNLEGAIIRRPLVSKQRIIVTSAAPPNGNGYGTVTDMTSGADDVRSGGKADIAALGRYFRF
jgi:hypothetical protein